MIDSVAAALRLFGGSNAGTPFETASTPVSAVQPEANARRTRKTVSRPPVSRDLRAAGSAALSAVMPSPNSDLREADREHRVDRERRTRRSGPRTRGPDSLTPRRLTTVSSTTKPSDSATACGASAGHRARDRRDAGDDRDRDRQHVVDQQRRGRDERRVLAEVRRG